MGVSSPRNTCCQGANAGLMARDVRTAVTDLKRPKPMGHGPCMQEVGLWRRARRNDDLGFEDVFALILAEFFVDHLVSRLGSKGAMHYVSAKPKSENEGDARVCFPNLAAAFARHWVDRRCVRTAAGVFPVAAPTT